MGSKCAYKYANHKLSKDEDSNPDLNTNGWTWDDLHNPLDDGTNDGLAYCANDVFGNDDDDNFDGHGHGLH